MTARTFRAEPADALIVRPLDDITLIYHRPSGQTHMVMSPVPEILSALDGPMTAADLLAHLLRDYDLGDPAEAMAAIETHLAELDALGLVRTA